MPTCYRHSDRETGVSCSNCGKPICTDCMTATSVGMRCPDCAKQKTQVRTVRSLGTEPTATYALIAICVLAHFGSGTRAWSDGTLVGFLVADGEYWRLLTSGFLHGGFVHLLLNMFALYFLGRELEPALGRERFLALYFTSLLAGSAGAVLLTDVDRQTVGASGAVFGLMGAAFILMRRRGIDPMQSGIGPLILFNLAFTFLVPGISIGGHLGGLLGGGIAALVLDRAEARSRGWVVPVAACGAMALVVAIAAVVAARTKVEALTALTSLLT